MRSNLLFVVQAITTKQHESKGKDERNFKIYLVNIYSFPSHTFKKNEKYQE